jgi:hypothetical protein
MTHMWIREELLAIKKSFSTSPRETGPRSITSPGVRRPHQSIRKKKGGLNVLRNFVDTYWDKWQEASANRIQISEENIGEEMEWEADAVSEDVSDGNIVLKGSHDEMDQFATTRSGIAVNHAGKTSPREKVVQQLQQDTLSPVNLNKSLLAGQIDAEGALTWKVVKKDHLSVSMSSRGPATNTSNINSSKDEYDKTSGDNSPNMAQRGWLDSFETIINFGGALASYGDSTVKAGRSGATKGLTRGGLMVTNSEMDMKLAGIGAELGQHIASQTSPKDSPSRQSELVDNDNGDEDMNSLRLVNDTSKDTQRSRNLRKALQQLKDADGKAIDPLLHKDSFEAEKATEYIAREDEEDNDDDVNYSSVRLVPKTNNRASKAAKENISKALKHIDAAETKPTEGGQAATNKDEDDDANFSSIRIVPNTNNRASALARENISQALKHMNSGGESAKAQDDDDEDNFSSVRLVPNTNNRASAMARENITQALKHINGGAGSAKEQDAEDEDNFSSLRVVANTNNRASAMAKENISMALKHLNGADEKTPVKNPSSNPCRQLTPSSGYKLGSKGEPFDMNTMDKADEQFVASMMQSVKFESASAKDDDEDNMGSLVITKSSQANTVAKANMAAAMKHLAENVTPPRYPSRDSAGAAGQSAPRSAPRPISSRPFSNSPNVSSSPYMDSDFNLSSTESTHNVLVDSTVSLTEVTPRSSLELPHDKDDSIDDVEEFFKLFSRHNSREDLDSNPTLAISAETLSSINATSESVLPRYDSVVDLLKYHTEVLKSATTFSGIDFDAVGVRGAHTGASSSNTTTSSGAANPVAKSGKQVSFSTNANNEDDVRASMNESLVQRAISRKQKRQTTLQKGASPQLMGASINRNSSHDSSNGGLSASLSNFSLATPTDNNDDSAYLDDEDEDDDDDDYGEGWWPVEDEEAVDTLGDRELEVLFRRSIRIQSTGINLNAQLDAMREQELLKCTTPQGHPDSSSSSSNMDASFLLNSRTVHRNNNAISVPRHVNNAAAAAGAGNAKKSTRYDHVNSDDSAGGSVSSSAEYDNKVRTTRK